jgi:hypothetical protein
VCPFLLPTVRLSPRTGLKSADPFHLSTVAIVPKKGGQNQPSPRGDRKMMLEVTVEEEVREVRAAQATSVVGRPQASSVVTWRPQASSAVGWRPRASLMTETAGLIVNSVFYRMGIGMHLFIGERFWLLWDLFW